MIVQFKELSRDVPAKSEEKSQAISLMAVRVPVEFPIGHLPNGNQKCYRFNQLA
jgi:hypothetical protein